MPYVFQCAEKCCFPIEARACHHLYELIDNVDAGGVYKAEVSTFLRRNRLSQWDLDAGAQMQEHLRSRVDAISTRTQGAPSREHEELHVQGKRTR